MSTLKAYKLMGINKYSNSLRSLLGAGEAIAGFGVNYVIILSVEKYFRLYN
ncbi:hypothetical protein [uncultured Nostoc sp.]|uniref:hypothetical protein n=1 Tax=uncultured Nostoc sp. TaxID=340711 RepID=UPI0035CAF3B7